MTADCINSFRTWCHYLLTTGVFRSESIALLDTEIISYSKRCEFWGFYSGVNEDSGLLGCDAMSLSEWPPPFPRNILAFEE
jgi:hypothetical protein